LPSIHRSEFSPPLKAATTDDSKVGSATNNVEIAGKTLVFQGFSRFFYFEIILIFRDADRVFLRLYRWQSN
jgi:hypothetical protein